jgi:hypothetical protein
MEKICYIESWEQEIVVLMMMMNQAELNWWEKSFSSGTAQQHAAVSLVAFVWHLHKRERKRMGGGKMLPEGGRRSGSRSGKARFKFFRASMRKFRLAICFENIWLIISVWLIYSPDRL